MSDVSAYLWILEAIKRQNPFTLSTCTIQKHFLTSYMNSSVEVSNLPRWGCQRMRRRSHSTSCIIGAFCHWRHPLTCFHVLSFRAWQRKRAGVLRSERWIGEVYRCIPKLVRGWVLHDVRCQYVDFCWNLCWSHYIGVCILWFLILIIQIVIESLRSVIV